MTACGTQCQLIDVQTQQIVTKIQDHSESVKCLGKLEESNIVASGGRDGKIFLYDLRISAP
jgi:WD40 repeat protein